MAALEAEGPKRVELQSAEDQRDLPVHGLLQHWPDPHSHRRPRLTLHSSQPDEATTRCGRQGADTYRHLREWPTGELILCSACFMFSANMGRGHVKKGGAPLTLV